MPNVLSRKVPLTELHCHLGGAVTPAIMWGIAHSQGIRLPTKDYWEFRDMITVSPRRARSFDGYLQLFHWTELIQSSPLAVERSVYEVVGGAYRRNNVTTMELRFNPMKRNRGGEQDLDHIISAATRGMDRAKLEYPVTPGLILCLDRAFPYQLNEIIVEKAIAYQPRGVVGVDIAGPESESFRPAEYKRLFDRVRRKGLGITVHTGESGPVEEIGEVIRQLEPSRIGHGVKAAYDPRTMDMIRERGITLEICPTSNLNTRVVSGWDEFRWIFDTFRQHRIRFTINTDGPEMLKTYIRDELTHAGSPGHPGRGRAAAVRRMGTPGVVRGGSQLSCRCRGGLPRRVPRWSVRRAEPGQTLAEPRAGHRTSTSLLDSSSATHLTAPEDQMAQEDLNVKKDRPTPRPVRLPVGAVRRTMFATTRAAARHLARVRRWIPGPLECHRPRGHQRGWRGARRHGCHVRCQPALLR